MRQIQACYKSWRLQGKQLLLGQPISTQQLKKHQDGSGFSDMDVVIHKSVSYDPEERRDEEDTSTISSESLSFVVAIPDT